MWRWCGGGVEVVWRWCGGGELKHLLYTYSFPKGFFISLISLMATDVFYSCSSWFSSVVLSAGFQMDQSHIYTDWCRASKSYHQQPCMPSLTQIDNYSK